MSKLIVELRPAASLAAVAIGLAYPSLSMAQADPRQLPVPSFKQTDELGVDLASGRFSVDSDPIQINVAGQNITAKSHNVLEIPRRTFEGWVEYNSSVYSAAGGINEHVVQIGPRSLIFRNERSGPYIPISPFSGKLEAGVYTDTDGTKYTFGIPYHNLGLLSKIEKRSGETINLYYKTGTIAPVRVISNLGWGINRTGNILSLYNRYYDYCPESTQDCVLAQSWPTLNDAVSGTQATYTASGHGQMLVSGRGTSNASITYSDGRAPIYATYGGGQGANVGRLTKLTVGGVTRNYSFVYSNTQQPILTDFSVSSTDQESRATTGRSCGGVLTYVQDPLGRRTDFQVCSTYSSWNATSNFPASAKYPEGNREQVQYSAGWKPAIVTAFGKDQTQFNTSTAMYANLYDPPSSITDNNGNVTEFEYERGQVVRETGPAVGGIRPVRRTEYAAMYATVKSASGGLVQVSSPVWMPVRVRTCGRTATIGTACAGGADDEVLTENLYSPDLQLRGIAVSSRSGTIWTCYGYDRFGNRIWETKPAAGKVGCS